MDGTSASGKSVSQVSPPEADDRCLSRSLRMRPPSEAESGDGQQSGSFRFPPALDLVAARVAPDLTGTAAAGIFAPSPEPAGPGAQVHGMGGAPTPRRDSVHPVHPVPPAE